MVDEYERGVCEMTPQSQSRLAQIRAHYEAWKANPPQGFETWEVPFLLKVIDELLDKKRTEVRG